MNAQRKAAELLIGGAERMLPRAQAGWAGAMAAETAHVASDRAALAFAAGCLFAACSERLRSFDPDGAWSASGLAAGVLLFSHALIPGSRVWPLIWPLLAGGAAVLGLQAGGRAPTFLGAVLTGLKAGVLGAAVFVGGAFILTLALGALGEPVAADLLLRLGVAAGLGALAATLGGTAVAPLVCRPPSSWLCNSNEGGTRGA